MGGHQIHFHPCTVELLLNGPSKEWSPPQLPSMYSGTSIEWSLQRVVTTSITIHVQWNLYFMVPPKGGHHLHDHPYTMEPLLYGPSKGWSPPPLPSMYNGTSTLWSLQRVVTTSITIHVQWNLYFMVPPNGGHRLHYHPCTVEPLLNGPSKGWSPPPLPSICSGISTELSLQWVVTTYISIHVQWNVYFMVPPFVQSGTSHERGAVCEACTKTNVRL